MWLYVITESYTCRLLIIIDKLTGSFTRPIDLYQTDFECIGSVIHV